MTNHSRILSAEHDNWNEVGELLVSLYATVNRLESMFPGRKFTPDGHLVGSIGEVIAAYMFDLELLPSSHRQHDAKSRDGRLVQIKFTQGNGAIAMYGISDHLIAMRMTPERCIDVVYNGPGAEPWSAAGKMQKNGQRPISLTRLRALGAKVAESDQIPVVQKVQMKLASQ